MGKKKKSNFDNFEGALYMKSLTMLSVNIDGFHVTSYQANFASHYTRHSHVGFLLALNNIGHTQKKCPVIFYLVHITIPDYKTDGQEQQHTLC